MNSAVDPTKNNYIVFRCSDTWNKPDRGRVSLWRNADGGFPDGRVIV